MQVCQFVKRLPLESIIIIIALLRSRQDLSHRLQETELAQTIIIKVIWHGSQPKPFTSQPRDLPVFLQLKLPHKFHDLVFIAGLLTQPLLTQTGSSSDSRDSRQSASYRVDFSNHRATPAVVPVDHWCSSGGSDASSDRKHSSKTQQIRL